MKKTENNFTAIRLVAAMFVFAGHLGVALNGPFLTVGGYSLHSIGVNLLFLESGYLIVKSWESDPNPVHYSIKRFMRLWPPFAGFILFMAYVVGPMLSSLGREGYFQNGYQIYLKNLRFYIVYALPGVFENLPAAYSINASFWTMPVEAALYILTPLLYGLFHLRKKEISFAVQAVITAALCIIDIVLWTGNPAYSFVIYGTDWVQAYHLATIYMIGMLYTRKELQKYLNLQAAVFAILAWMIFEPADGALKYTLFYLVVPYATFSFALAPKPMFSKLGRHMELSYGIYLYGFFFCQLVIYLQMKHGITPSYMKNFVLSLIPTLAASMLSYFLIEKPTRRLAQLLIYWTSDNKVRKLQ